MFGVMCDVQVEKLSTKKGLKMFLGLGNVRREPSFLPRIPDGAGQTLDFSRRFQWIAYIDARHDMMILCTYDGILTTEPRWYWYGHF